MAKTKNVRLISPVQGLTLYFSVTYIPSDQGIPSSYLDATDMMFRAAPTTAYHDLTESTTVPGTYEFSDDTIEWVDGFYKFDFWAKLGGVKAPTTDDILAVTQNRIKINDDTIYSTFQTTDVKTVVEDAANSIIAALGVTIGADYEGVATGGSNTTIVEALAMWNVNIWASTGDLENLCIVESAASGERYGSKIVSNTNTTLTVGALAGGYIVVAGDKFYIKRNSNAVDVKSIGATAQTGIDLGVQIPLINTKLDTVESSLTDIETDIESTNTKIDTVNTNLGTIETDIEAVNTDTTSIDGKLTDTNTKLDTIESSLTDIETDVEAINTDTTAILADTANIDANVTDILADTANIDTNVGTIASDTTTIAGDTTSIDGKMTDNNTKLDTLEASLTDIETDIEATNTALGTIETDIEATNTALGTIEDDLEVLTASTPTIYNVSIAAADTEYSQALPAHTKAFAISIINGTVGENFRWAFETGKVATPTASYRQIDQEFEYSKDNLDISETIYIAASDICVAQLEVWT